MGQRTGDPHDLLLVDDHAVGILQDLFQRRELIADRLLTVPPFDKLVDHTAVEGTGPVEGH